jgi:hypothetical protein
LGYCGTFGLSLTDLQTGTNLQWWGLKEAKAKFEASLITRVLQQFQGNVQLASKALAISRSMIYHLIQKYDLKQYVTSTHEDVPGIRPIRPAGVQRRGRRSAPMDTVEIV